MPVLRKSRTYRSQAEWVQLFDEFALSETAVGVFCKQRGITPSNFYYWRRKLAGHRPRAIAAVSEPGPLLEIPLMPNSGSAHWRLELDLGQGVVLRLR